MKESYDNMELLSKKARLDEHAWKIFADLKVITILLGLQQGYTK